MPRPPRRGVSHDEPDGFSRQSFEEAADAIDDTPAPTEGWDTIPDCIEAVERHIKQSHGLTSDKEFLWRIRDFLKEIAEN